MFLVISTVFFTTKNNLGTQQCDLDPNQWVRPCLPRQMLFLLADKSGRIQLVMSLIFEWYASINAGLSVLK